MTLNDLDLNDRKMLLEARKIWLRWHFSAPSEGKNKRGKRAE